MKSSDYWQRRFEGIENTTTATGEESIRNMERIFSNAQHDLQNQIAGWYDRFATNNQIDLPEARRLLNSNELAEFRWTVEEYTAYAKANTVSGQWVRQLENASARVHISRLEALHLQTQHTMERLFGNQLDAVDSVIKRQFLDNYHHSIFEVQSGFNVGWDIAGIPEAQIQALMGRPWASDNLTFSDRIWRDKNRLVHELQTQLTQGLIAGTPPNVTINNIAAAMGTTKSNAARLVMTESAAIAAVAHEKAYRELGTKLIEILATLDKKTSEICRRMDGKVIRIEEYKVGVTVPPFHPWCRSTTVPHFDDDFGQRAARDEDGKTYYVPGDMKYPEWEQTFVDGGAKSHLQETDSTLRTFTEKVDSINGISSEYREALIHRFQAGTNAAKDVFNRFVPLNSVVTGSAKGAKYSHGDKRIHMNFANDMNNVRGNATTFFHEQGHLIDYLQSDDSRGISIQRGRFRIAKKSDGYLNRLATSLSADYNDMVERMIDPDESAFLGRGNVHNQLSVILRGENADMLSAVSDILEGMTNTSSVPVRGKWGHGSKYWKQRPLGVYTEAFAHLFELQFDPQKLNAFAEYFPSTVNVFAEIMEELR
ncbi:MAG: minor capsid protein [Defluviitaleaceae bacterium]|nr:minor capsid protein [Defluviitaleaceae bacterium]